MVGVPCTDLDSRMDTFLGRFLFVEDCIVARLERDFTLFCASAGLFWFGRHSIGVTRSSYSCCVLR